jgi:hypothetical protein
MMGRMWLFAPLLAGCSLLVQFDREGQPCDAANQCLNGYTCVSGFCRSTDAGVEQCEPACGSDERCVNGSCYPTVCGTARCAEGAVCLGTRCSPVSCVGVSCADTQQCIAGTCEPRRCGAVDCRPGDACRDGRCVDVSCQGLTCPSGLRCTQGACVSCSTREASCADGLDDDCDGLTDCADSDCAGQPCDDGDPCTINEQCGSGTCQRGQRKICNAPPNNCKAMLGECEAGTGVCHYPNLADATLCGSTTAQRCCSGTCVDLARTASHCGGCGLSCAPTRNCIPLEASGCAGEPANTSGRCGCTGNADCPAGQICTMGACAPASLSQCAMGQQVQAARTCSTYCRY